jgi:hypothetical protein
MGYDLDSGFRDISADVGHDATVPMASFEEAYGHDDEEGALPDGHRATDVGNAARLLHLADGKLRHVHAWGKWLVYQNGRWIIDENDVLVTEHAKGVARRLFKMTADITGDKDLRERAWNWSLRSETSGAIAAMIRLSRGAPGILVEHEQLDARFDDDPTRSWDQAIVDIITDDELARQVAAALQPEPAQPDSPYLDDDGNLQDPAGNVIDDSAAAAEVLRTLAKFDHARANELLDRLEDTDPAMADRIIAKLDGEE